MKVFKKILSALLAVIILSGGLVFSTPTKVIAAGCYHNFIPVSSRLAICVKCGAEQQITYCYGGHYFLPISATSSVCVKCGLQINR